MNNTYKNAVDHLEFSDDLLERVQEKTAPRSRFSMVRAVIIAAAVICLMVTTAFAASMLRKIDATADPVGKETESFEDVLKMEFTEPEQFLDGVSVHYLELEPDTQYGLSNGYLYTYGENPVYYRVTEDYELVPATMTRVCKTFEKNGNQYLLDFIYADTESGVLSNSKQPYFKDENGEILLNAIDDQNNLWPLYLNVETGEIRDALPEFTADDFTGSIRYTYVVNGGFLVSTLVETGAMVDVYDDAGYAGQQDEAYNLLYWIHGDVSIPVELPDNVATYFVDNETLYYQELGGALYRMDENLNPVCVSEYQTGDGITNGLITVSVGGKLGVVDLLTDELFVFDSIDAQKEDLSELGGYNAKRYGNDGPIAVIQCDHNMMERRLELMSFGILDKATGELKYLEVENPYNCEVNSWLDDHRFGVIYKDGDNRYLCIYEFDSI